MLVTQKLSDARSIAMLRIRFDEWRIPHIDESRELAPENGHRQFLPKIDLHAARQHVLEAMPCAPAVMIELR